MTDRDAIRLLSEALERLGVSVRCEPLPDEAPSAGGFCTLRGQPVVVLASDASAATRIALMVDALRRLDTDEIWLPPAIRQLL